MPPHTQNFLRTTQNDVFYTHPDVAKLLVAMCDLQPGDRVLDPSRGAGVFYDNFPEWVDKEWAEIEEGRDFFDTDEVFDWVIGNPPFSMLDKWLDFTTQITFNFAYVFNTQNLTPFRLERLRHRGFHIQSITMCRIDYWFGITMLVVFKHASNIMGDPHTIRFDHVGKTFVCPDCGKTTKTCGRGQKGQSVNQCGFQPKQLKQYYHP